MTGVLVFIQFFFSIVIGLYFLSLLKGQQVNKTAVDKESRKELERLRQMREITLTEPLSEKTRPSSFDEIIGQEEGIKALRAALCSPNPQHVIIYGPPGVGKTCAARLVLEEAKHTFNSPFRKDAKFIEMDATSIRFDERSIADPLIGSVHDPIYQGAGPLGVAGIPQPKPGAVTKAHGGILFLDEIGELHPIQMNKLLKVLEDRKVFLESAYYNSQDSNIPGHIHDIFQNGLPADFRLVGATTRNPSEISPAIRSRCLEIFFRALNQEEIMIITKNGAEKGGFSIEERAAELVCSYATNGREAINMVQLAGGLALTGGRRKIQIEDIEWVINCGNYNRRPEKSVPLSPQIGCVNGLAVYGPNLGTIMDIEAVAIPTLKGKGTLTITGMIDEEEIGSDMKRLKRKSTARSSVDNVVTVMRKYLDIDTKDYDIHLNFPGGVPVDGPSAGIGIITAIYSAVENIPIDNTLAMTGEVSIRGDIKPVGGIPIKIEAAKLAGARKVIIPRDNWQDGFKATHMDIIPVTRIEEVIAQALYGGDDDRHIKHNVQDDKLLSALGN